MSKLKAGIRAALVPDFVPINSAGATLDLGGLAGTADTGDTITDAVALNVSAFWRGVNLISSGIAALPLHVYERIGDEGKERARDHPLYTVLHSQANSRMTSFTVRQTMAAHAITWGNGFAEKQKNGRGEILGLWPLNPARMSVEVERLTVQQLQLGLLPRLRYRYRTARGDERIYSADDIHHLRGLGNDGLVGYPLLTLMRNSIALARSGERAQAAVFTNSARPSVALMHPSSMPGNKRRELADDWRSAYSGSANAGKVAVLEDGIKLQPFGFPPEDAQFLQTRTFQVVEFARWLGLPPHKLYELSRATFSNIEQQALEYLSDSLNPPLVNWEQQMLMDLFRPGFDDGFFPEFDRNGIMQVDARTRAFFYQTMVGMGAMMPDEVRSRETMNELPEGVGKRTYIPMNWDQVEAEPTRQPRPALASVPPAEDDSAARAMELNELTTRIEALELAQLNPEPVGPHSHRNGNGSEQ